jgi:hypothetical protein
VLLHRQRARERHAYELAREGWSRDEVSATFNVTPAHVEDLLAIAELRKDARSGRRVLQI